MPTLTTQMKSVGEAMAIGRTFKEAMQKALRSLETGRAGFGADGKDERAQADDRLDERSWTDPQSDGGAHLLLAARAFGGHGRVEADP